MTPFLLIFKDYFKCDIKKFGLRKWRSSDGWDFFPKYKTILIFFFIFKIFDRFLDKKKCQKILNFLNFFFISFFYSNFDRKSNFMKFKLHISIRKSSKSHKFHDFNTQNHHFWSNFKKNSPAAGTLPGRLFKQRAASGGRLRRGYNAFKIYIFSKSLDLDTGNLSVTH